MAKNEAQPQTRPGTRFWFSIMTGYQITRTLSKSHGYKIWVKFLFCLLDSITTKSKTLKEQTLPNDNRTTKIQSTRPEDLD